MRKGRYAEEVMSWAQRTIGRSAGAVARGKFGTRGLTVMQRQGRLSEPSASGCSHASYAFAPRRGVPASLQPISPASVHRNDLRELRLRRTHAQRLGELQRADLLVDGLKPLLLAVRVHAVTRKSVHHH